MRSFIFFYHFFALIKSNDVKRGLNGKMQKRNSYFFNLYFFTQNFITSFIVDIDEDKLFGLKEGT